MVQKKNPVGAQVSMRSLACHTMEVSRFGGAVCRVAVQEEVVCTLHNNNQV